MFLSDVTADGGISAGTTQGRHPTQIPEGSPELKRIGVVLLECPSIAPPPPSPFTSEEAEALEAERIAQELSS